MTQRKDRKKGRMWKPVKAEIGVRRGIDKMSDEAVMSVSFD